MQQILRPALALCLAVAVGPSAAQEVTNPAGDIFDPALVAPTFEDDSQSDPLAMPAPYAPQVQPNPVPQGLVHGLSLHARLTETAAPLAEGVVWRVFGPEPDSTGNLPLISTARGGSITVPLAPGDYLVHAGFGRAGATKRVRVAGDGQTESLVLDAGGLKLDAVVGEDEPVSPQRLSFEILQESQNGELVTVVPEAKPGLVVRLGAGTYHVISRYGDINAVVRADIQIEPGKLTEAVMRHAGAELTLKLVASEGGEALANTDWTVLTEAGDTVHESTGAFPSIVLAEGNYTAVAKHQDQIYSRDFTVEAGVDRDVEVRLSDLVPEDNRAAPNDGYAPPARAAPAPIAQP